MIDYVFFPLYVCNFSALVIQICSNSGWKCSWKWSIIRNIYWTSINRINYYRVNQIVKWTWNWNYKCECEVTSKQYKIHQLVTSQDIFNEVVIGQCQTNIHQIKNKSVTHCANSHAYGSATYSGLSLLYDVLLLHLVYLPGHCSHIVSSFCYHPTLPLFLKSLTELYKDSFA